MKRALTLDTDVPFGGVISGWLQVNGMAADAFVQHSRRFERSYLAWETVRKVRNPYFEDGTGFEGYFIGRLGSPEAALAQLLKIGQEMIDNNRRLYRFNPLFRAKLMRTIQGELDDPKCIEVWAAQFGAALGRLRCNLLTNEEASRFQTETYWQTHHLPGLCYQFRQRRIVQRYTIPFEMTGHAAKWSLRHEVLRAGNLDALMVATSVGKFGHPLLRAYLNMRLTLFGS